MRQKYCVTLYLHGTFALFDHLKERACFRPLSILMDHSIRSPPTFINRRPSGLLIGPLVDNSIALRKVFHTVDYL